MLMDSEFVRGIYVLEKFQNDYEALMFVGSRNIFGGKFGFLPIIKY